MSTTQVVLVVLVLAVVAVAAAVAVQARRRQQLKGTFGPEYDRTVEQAGGTRAAERELVDRARRHDELDIHPLSQDDRAQHAERWRRAQERFVDEPEQAVREADGLIAQVMQQRGYPVGDFDQQARDVSVEHARVVEHYRAAHAISDRSDRGEASTEDLRAAMVHYRVLFDELLEPA